MKIEFVYGRIDLKSLRSIDALVCPTDTNCSGGGGLDLAIHQAAGPELAAALKDVHLSVGSTVTTKGFQLGVKQIIHAAIPKAAPSDPKAEALRQCYRNIFWALDKGNTKTAVITLLGTGHCGWSREQSMAALWSAILDHHRGKTTSWFDDKAQMTLSIYYPKEAHNIAWDYKYRTSQAFFDPPEQWGLRGDLWLWYALMDHFDDPKFNRISPSDFIKEIQQFFHKRTGVWLCGDTNTYIKDLDHGGMSGGGVSSFMAETGIPLLCSNLVKLRLYRSKSPSFILPVNLQTSSNTEYSLTLPYELLPELAHLRNPQHRMNEKKKFQLVISKPYYLATYHYHNAPDLIDYYSLDVENANDSHYRFSQEAAAQICKQLGYQPIALGAALSVFLKTRGGGALEALIQQYATKEYHYD